MHPPKGNHDSPDNPNHINPCHGNTAMAAGLKYKMIVAEGPQKGFGEFRIETVLREVEDALDWLEDT